MCKKPFYITTPIYYPSGNAHIGHSYCTVATDAIARYKREQNYDVMFLTGTDEHGSKIEEKAKEKGVTPKAYVDEIVANFKNLWELLNISNDRFIRTTDEYHVKSVQKIFNDLYNKGAIYKGKYEGWYCTPCESFWTETQLVDKKCPDCGREVKWGSEDAYFFKLSEYGDRLLEYYEKNPSFIQPESRKNEMISFIKRGLDDLCVTRTSITWGVPIDFDPKHVVYVWLDALTNYITALGYGNDEYNDFDKYWPANVHFVGKEIVRFHTIIWPAMLMALDIPLPDQVYGHGWLLFGDGTKMSKSKGNVVDPYILCDRYGVDAIRYFLLREIPFGSDGVFTNESLIGRINSDLANDLGNLLSRTCAMTEKYFGGTLIEDRKVEDIDSELINLATSLKATVEENMDKYQFSTALAKIWTLISRTNKYIDETAPWALAKDEANKPRLATVLYNLAESLRIVAVLLRPFLPQTTPKILAQIGANESVTKWEDSATFGLLPNNATLVKGEILFPRIDVDKEIDELNAIFAPSAPKEEVKEELKAKEEESLPQINIDDFFKVELRVAKVLACEPVKKAKKLLKITLDDGQGERVIVSGIAMHYTPDDLIGHNIVVVANLAPAKLCGVESNGMLLATDTADGQVKVMFADELPVGGRLH